MSDVRALTVTAELVDYAVAHGSELPGPVLDDLRAETAALGPPAGMQIGPDEGQLLTLLTRLVGARRAVEVGTFTGYSSLCIARGLAPGGALTCCDVSEEWTAIARRAWNRARLADRIELRIAPALDTLRSLPAEPHIDLAFLDADNVLWWGGVVEPRGPAEANEPDDNTRAIRAFNDHVAADDRVDVAVLPAFDGLTIPRRRLRPGRRAGHTPSCA